MGLYATMTDQDALCAWAAPRLGVAPGLLPSESVALGIRDRETDEIAAVIVYNAFYSHYCSMHVASNGGKRWLTKGLLRVIFGYAFEHRGVMRVNAVVADYNTPIQILCLKLGFRVEATIRCGANDGSNGILFGMLAPECPWIKAREIEDGKV